MIKDLYQCVADPCDDCRVTFVNSKDEIVQCSGKFDRQTDQLLLLLLVYMNAIFTIMARFVTLHFWGASEWDRQHCVIHVSNFVPMHPNFLFLFPRLTL